MHACMLDCNHIPIVLVWTLLNGIIMFLPVDAFPIRNLVYVFLCMLECNHIPIALVWASLNGIIMFLPVQPGYERLCCLRCMQPRDHNFQTTCVCRVPKHLREEKVIECVHCGCRGCASGDWAGAALRCLIIRSQRFDLAALDQKFTLSLSL